MRLTGVPAKSRDFVGWSAEDVLQRVLGQRIRLLLGPVGRIRRLPVAVGLHLRSPSRRDPAALDEGGGESDDRIVAGRFLPLFFCSGFLLAVPFGRRGEPPAL